MLKNLKTKQQQEGFTIIEVMIVLVIAAVILLIVFLAVPALQRNSRNTSKKNAAASLLSAATEYDSNINGADLTASVSSTGGTTDADKILALVNTNGTITKLTVRAQSGAAPTSLTDAFIETKAKCQTQTGGTPPVTTYTTAGSSSRQIAMLYAVEGANGSITPSCIEGGL